MKAALLITLAFCSCSFLTSEKSGVPSTEDRLLQLRSGDSINGFLKNHHEKIDFQKIETLFRGKNVKENTSIFSIHLKNRWVSITYSPRHDLTKKELLDVLHGELQIEELTVERIFKEETPQDF